MDIKLINDKTIITCCSMGDIIVSDFFNKVCQLKIPNVHKYSLNLIKFDYIN